jgi:phosphoacetylglucosamine mutase
MRPNFKMATLEENYDRKDNRENKQSGGRGCYYFRKTGGEEDVQIPNRATQAKMAEKLSQKLFQNVSEKSLKYPKPEVKFTYGTAGFRLKAELLPSVMYRMGLLAVLRSRACGSKTIGLMITASHNPVQDNGVKLIDPMGEMLEADWEKYATELANSDEVGKCLKDLTEQVKLKSVEWNDVGNVVVARDTRPSGSELAQAALDGAEAFGGKFNDLGK